jgi:hypothetical protein
MMSALSKIDIRENKLRTKGRVLGILISDKTTGKNIIWATESYLRYNKKKYLPKMQIKKEQITGQCGNLIQPRASKSREEQIKRTKEKAEVFTPLHIVNKMNTQIARSLRSTPGHTWLDFVNSTWLEIACGEGPFIAGRYNPATSSNAIVTVSRRVGFLDRKLQQVSKHTSDKVDWLYHAETALKACYGYEWQGDNLLIARENILFTINDYYLDKFGKNIKTAQLEKFAEIISWNIFQMDGLKYVVPMSCKHFTKTILGQPTILDGTPPDIVELYECEGCKKNDYSKHNGKYVKIMDWATEKPIKFVTLL